VTVGYITDGIKRLRAVGASLPDANAQRDFWRGMRNVELPEDFRKTGGTEFAPLSTSSELKVCALGSGLGLGLGLGLGSGRAALHLERAQGLLPRHEPRRAPRAEKEEQGCPRAS
jgi:hypothetical protein